MSKITTPIANIHQMLSRVAQGESIEFDEEDVLVLAARIATAIEKGFKGRKARVRDDKVIYFSELGSPCHRKVWYKAKGYEGEQLTPSALVKFLYGDILEEFLLFLVEQAGSEVTERQGEREMDLGYNGWKVRGRIDAVIDGQLIDVKSASSPSFKKIVEGRLNSDDAFGYLSQLYGYWSANEEGHPASDDHPAFLVIDKTLGTIGYGCYAAKMSKAEVNDRVVMKGQALAKELEQDEPPERPYDDVPDGKSGNRKLGTACSYCPYKAECWKESNGGKGPRTFFYSGGPRFLTNVAKTPDVPEMK